MQNVQELEPTSLQKSDQNKGSKLKTPFSMTPFVIVLPVETIQKFFLFFLSFFSLKSKMPKLRPVSSLQQLSIEKMTEYIASISKFEKCETSILTPFLEKLKELLVTTLPDGLLNALVENVVTLFDTYMNHLNDFGPKNTLFKYGYKCNQEIITSIAEVVLHPLVTKWDSHVCMRHLTFDKLCTSSKLKYLSLNYDHWYEKYIPKFYLVTAVSKMPHLEYIRLNSCTNEVIHAIAKNCPEVSTIIIYSSPQVNDSAAPSLLRCNKLNKIGLKDTELSATSIAELLIELPNLIEVDLKLEPIESEKLVKLLNEKLKKRPLAVKSLTLSNYLESYSDLVEVFPKMEELFLNCKNNFDDFHNLEHLKHLSLSITSNKCVDELFHVSGAYLTSLEIFETTNTFYNDYYKPNFNLIMIIGKFCKQLKSLVIHNGINYSYDDDENAKINILQFEKLENLTILGYQSNACDFTHFIYMLRNAKNIKKIHLRNVPVVDDWIEAILALNPMRRLQILNIEFVDDESDLDMYSISLLCESCTDLRKIGNIFTWHEMFECRGYCNKLKKLIKSNNYDLEF